MRSLGAGGGGVTVPNATNVYLSTITWPQVAAHRMTTTRYGENTIQSGLVQLASGVEVLDGDFWFSSDGVATMMHDSTIDRTTNGSGTVSALTWAQLSSYAVDAGSGYNAQPIPQLSDLVVFKGSAIVTVEHKPGPGVSEVEALADSLAGMEDTLIVQSFWGTATEAWRDAGFTALVLHNTPDLAASLFGDGYEWVGHEFTGSGTSDQIDLIEESKAAGLKVMTYTHSTLSDANAAIAAGADMANLDNPSGR